MDIMSVNLATHYRPQKFEDVVGQDVAKTVLKKIAMAPGISARAIFLKGSWGSGKTTLCKIFAKAMNCENFHKLGDVCNECPKCKEASAKNSQLYFEFDSSVVGNVDSIRNLQEQLAFAPNGRRVVVFDEIHAASRAAQNAMLKMVEDGIPNTIFVFASTDDVIPTIKSRSICVDISTIPHNLIKKRVLEIANIQGIEVDEPTLDLIAIKSGGHMRDALSILQLYQLCGKEGLKSSYNLIVQYFSKLLSKQFDEARVLISEIVKYNIVDIRNSIYVFIRNVYAADSESKFYKLQQSGVINKIFSFFFNPVAQSALKDEVGVELLLRNLIDKMSR